MFLSSFYGLILFALRRRRESNPLMCDEPRHVARPCVWPHGDKLHHTHIKERAHRRLRAAAAYPFSGLSPAKSGVHYPSRTVQRLEKIYLEQLSAQAAGVEPANVLTFQRKTSHAPQEPAIQRLCASGAPGVPCPDAAYPLSGLSPAIKRWLHLCSRTRATRSRGA